jgi:hypothetical protein
VIHDLIKFDYQDYISDCNEIEEKNYQSPFETTSDHSDLDKEGETGFFKNKSP